MAEVVRRRSRLLAVLSLSAAAGMLAACSSGGHAAPPATHTSSPSSSAPSTTFPSPSTAATTPQSQTPHLPAATALPAGTRKYRLPKLQIGGVESLVYADGAIWTSAGVYRIDPHSGAVAGPYDAADAGGDDTVVAVTGGSVWETSFDHNHVTRMDERTGKIIGSVELGDESAPVGIIAFAGSLWVAEHHGGTVDRIDPATAKVTTRIPIVGVGSSGPSQLTAAFGSVWVGVPRLKATYRIDPATNRVPAAVEFDGSNPCGGLGASSHRLWATSCLETNTLLGLDPTTNAPAVTADYGGLINGVAGDGSSLWIVAGPDPDADPMGHGDLMKIDEQGAVHKRIDLGPGFESGPVVIADGAVWVANFNQPVVLRIPLS